MTEPLFVPERVCRKCGAARSLEGKYCLACHNRSNMRRRRLDPDVIRAENIRKMYGLTLADYDAMREAHDYRCATCGIHEDDIVRMPVGRPRKDGSPRTLPVPLEVDHCHATGKVRGLLCPACNRGLGFFKDNTAALRAAATYIERHRILGTE